MRQLSLSMAIIIVGLQFVNQFQSVLLPMITQFFARRTWNLYKAKRNITTHLTTQQEQHIADDILGRWSQRDELMSKVVQFGFISFFTVGFPLAPLFTFLNNTLEIRFGAYRLVVQSKRPFTTRSQGIGTWFDIMTNISRMAILINALIVAFSSSYFNRKYLSAVSPDYKFGAQLLFVLLFEHVVLLCVVSIYIFVQSLISFQKERRT
jgi:hypothetical protein